MKRNREFGIFSKDEQKYYLWTRNMRDRMFSQFAVLLLSRGIRPSHVSLVGVLSIVPFVLFFSINPWISFIFLLLSIFADSVDGVMARVSNANNRKGAFVDFVSDYLVYFAVFFTLLWYGLISSFWGAFHVLNYLVMQSFVFYANFMNIEIFPVIRSKFLVYLFLLIWLLSGMNLFDPMIIMMNVYMVVTNLFLFFKIKWEL